MLLEVKGCPWFVFLPAVHLLLAGVCWLLWPEAAELRGTHGPGGPAGTEVEELMSFGRWMAAWAGWRRLVYEQTSVPSWTLEGV